MEDTDFSHIASNRRGSIRASLAGAATVTIGSTLTGRTPVTLALQQVRALLACSPWAYSRPAEYMR